MHLYKPFLLSLLLILFAGKLSATHFYGVDLFYSHVSGNTYKVSMVAYGDCIGAQFPSFSTQRPRIFIRRGNTEFLNDFLDQEPPKEGIEVTPVCPAELNKTTCVNPAGTVPGVKKFVYSKEFTLSGPAPDWKFVFLGGTDGSTIAGRSNSLTNVITPGVISLEATLDNTQQFNSSPEYTTIATPFYCIGRATNFNPGAVDADGDSLVYELVPGLDGLQPLPYVTSFSGSYPLAAARGTFSFSRRTGQLAFTPDRIQRSLVVYRVSEYRNGVLLGTSMREMTVVIMPCDNNPPGGLIPGAEGATVVDSVTVRTCIGKHEVSFDINPVDADNGHTINMVAKGLPAGSRLDITNNNTTRPLSRFTWNMPDLPEGDYTFFVTYTDNGCPIASKQTQAYTVRIQPDTILAEATKSDCGTPGTIKVTVPKGWVPWNYKIYQGSATVYSMAQVPVFVWRDSMEAGKYRVEAVNHLGCTAETEIEIPVNCDIADVPTAFTPNGDGKNDILYVRGGNDIKEMYFRIYNRWGQLVFETNNINKGWDGRYKGVEAPVEAYAYVLSVVFNSSTVVDKKGNITLIR